MIRYEIEGGHLPVVICYPEAGETLCTEKGAMSWMSSNMRMDTNTAVWTERDGWWYYGKAVSDGDMTQPLFREVTFDGPSMTNEYQNCTVQIDVTAQSVQQANNGASALEAAGWPEA